MTAHDPASQWPEKASPLHSVASAHLMRPLAGLAILTVAAAGGLLVLSHPIGARLFPSIDLPDLGVAAGALLLAAFGLVACFRMVRIRQRTLIPNKGTARISALRVSLWPQTILTVLFITATVYTQLAKWPPRQADAHALMTLSGFTAASILLLLATPWLLAERYIATITPEALPESIDLRTLLYLPVFFLGAQAVLQVAGSLGLESQYWARAGLSLILLLICAELTLRLLATWFLPPADSTTARAPISSFIAGALRGRSLSPSAVASAVRSQFGMDFSRSWALHFMRTMAAPVVLMMLALCWFLTGVTRIDLNERGAYERFGTVATILKPGLHLVLPWPLGVVRHVELGVIHSALISGNDQNVATEAADHSTAEGDAPASASRLWDSEQPTDVSYIIASSEQNRQTFQTVSASVRVLYRLGLNDTDAQAVLYRETDPDALVRLLAGRLLAQFFAAHTLPSVLGESQGIIAGEVRTRLRQALDHLGSGIEIVAVTIEAIHPPAGAASAYRNVQAAEIAATTSIATERGRSQTTGSVAQLNAHNATNDAAAAAAETISAAQVDLTDLTVDDRAYRAASPSFLLERYFTDLRLALANVPLEIIDHRLTGASLPTIDLRPPGAVRDGLDAHSSQVEKAQ